MGQWVWALGVCASFFGWGSALARLPGLPRDPGSAGCLGVAFAVACGGVLDLFRIVTPAVAIGFVFAGVVLTAAQYLPAIRLPRGMPKGAAPRLLLMATILLAAIAIVGHVYYPEFSRFDDYPAYLVYPEKMLATGSLGFEPFSERRLLASLGGLYFLHTLVLAGADFYFLHALDPALALGLILLLLEAAMRRQLVPLAWRLGVLLFVLLLLPSIPNLSALLLPIALMLFAYLLLETEPDRHRLGRIVALALVGAAMVAIKPAYLSWTGSFLAVVYGRRLVLDRFRSPAWREPAAIVALTGLVLLPWMLAQLRDTGTALYPLLGPGFHASRYGEYPTVWALLTPARAFAVLSHESWTLIPQLLACVLIFGLAWQKSTDRRANVVTLYFLLSSLVLFVVIAVGTAMEELIRYTYPGVATALLAALYRIAVAGPRIGRSWFATVVAACLVLVANNAHGLAQYYGRAVTDLGIAALGPAFRPAMLAGVLARDNGAERLALLRMQQAIPAGATFMERLDYPFLLDFRRNQVFVADWPGAVALPPGMPISQGPEKLAAYLLSVSVRYVAYAYASQAKFPHGDPGLPTSAPWIELDTKRAFDFQDNLAALMQTHRLVFKDDERVVIDLAEPAGR